MITLNFDVLYVLRLCSATAGLFTGLVCMVIFALAWKVGQNT